MNRTRGLADVTQLRTERRASGVVQTMRDGAAPPSRIHIDDIAPNPRNPPGRAEQIEDLVASIQRRGVLVPILVTPAEEWVAKHPEDSDHVAGRQWVAQDGHRRLAATRAAGKTEVPFAVRGVDIDEALIRLHTAKSMRLSPIEEAQQYRSLIDTEKMTQQEIAAETGVSQGHVAKRLKLLELPAPLRALVDFGRVDVGAALALATSKDNALIDRVATEIGRLELGPTPVSDGMHLPDENAPLQVDLATLTRRATEELSVERGREAARVVAEELDAEYCENVMARLGEARISNQIFSKVAAKAAATAHNLLVVPSPRGEPNYYLIAPEVAPLDKAKLEQRRIAAATSARAKALRIAAAARVSPVQIQETLATLILTGLGLGVGETTRLAYDVARDAGLAPDGLGDLAWRRSLTFVPQQQRLQHAWIIALASLEAYTRSTKTAWGSVHAYYFVLLGSVAGYVPGEWEQGRLDVITNLDTK